MKLQQFSLEQFVRAVQEDKTESLVEELYEIITLELHKHCEPKIREIVSELNNVGHNLKPYGECSVGEFSYRDDALTDMGQYECLLRLAVDTVLSVGYRDTVEDDDHM